MNTFVGTDSLPTLNFSLFFNPLYYIIFRLKKTNLYQKEYLFTY